MTYSLALTGLRADSQFAVSNVKVGDAALADGGHNLVMSQNTPVLCKNPDGSQSWYTLDAERTTASAIVLKPV